MYLTWIEQKEHFAILRLIWEAVWYLQKDSFDHLSFWLYQQWGKKMSSREWNVSKLSDIFDAVDSKLNDDILSNASILINDLKQQINKSVEFNIEKIIDPIWNTWVYLMYTAVRWKKILKENNYVFSKNHIKLDLLSPEYKKFMWSLFKYKSILESGINWKKLHIIITYAFEIARWLSYLYTGWEKISAIKNDDKKEAMLAIWYLWAKIIEDIFLLMNITLPEKM
jgi:arginyl-tRNA synthetase